MSNLPPASSDPPPSAWAEWRNTCLASFCVLATVCVTSIICSPDFALPPKPIGDGLDYENLAYHVWQGDGFVIDTSDADWRSLYDTDIDRYAAHLNAPYRELSATGRPPLYPALIAGVYSVLGRNATAMMTVRILAALSIALSGGMAAATCWQLLRVRFGGTTWLLAAFGAGSVVLFAAANRTLISYATDFLTEPFALLATQAFVTLALWPPAIAGGKKEVSLRRVFTLGVVLGCMILLRSMFVLWLPLLALLIVIQHQSAVGQRLTRGILLVAVACLVCSPWWVRNVIVTQSAMPLGTQGPITLLGGYCDASLASAGEWQFGPELALRHELAGGAEYQSLSGTLREVELSRVAKTRVFDWIDSHRSVLPALFRKRIVTHWNPYSGRSLVWKCLLLLGAGFLIKGRMRSGVWLLGMPLISTLVVAVLYTTGGRFLVPLYGCLLVVSGFGIGAAAHWIQQFWSPRPE